jgi:hypothetical protein
MPAPSRPNPSATAAHTSSPVSGREPFGSWAVVELTVVVVVATVAGGVVDVVGGGCVGFVGGGEFDVEVVGQPSGSTYCESPAPPHPLLDPASADPAPTSNGTPIAMRHANTSPSLLMGASIASWRRGCDRHGCPRGLRFAGVRRRSIPPPNVHPGVTSALA